jgi:predicted NBD/HSP70 family sugar kinase
MTFAVGIDLRGTRLRVALVDQEGHIHVLLLPHIRRMVESRATIAYRDVPIEAAHLGDAAGVIGAAALILDP